MIVVKTRHCILAVCLCIWPWSISATQPEFGEPEYHDDCIYHWNTELSSGTAPVRAPLSLLSSVAVHDSSLQSLFSATRRHNSWGVWQLLPLRCGATTTRITPQFASYSCNITVLKTAPLEARYAVCIGWGVLQVLWLPLLFQRHVPGELMTLKLTGTICLFLDWRPLLTLLHISLSVHSCDPRDPPDPCQLDQAVIENEQMNRLCVFKQCEWWNDGISTLSTCCPWWRLTTPTGAVESDCVVIFHLGIVQQSCNCLISLLISRLAFPDRVSCSVVMRVMQMEWEVKGSSFHNPLVHSGSQISAGGLELVSQLSNVLVGENQQSATNDTSPFWLEKSCLQMVDVI